MFEVGYSADLPCSDLGQMTGTRVPERMPGSEPELTARFSSFEWPGKVVR